MKILTLSFLAICVFLPNLITSPVLAEPDVPAKLQPYLSALEEKGNDPVEFVEKLLERCDLILFDDALHTAVEPFEFYHRLIKQPGFSDKARYIFLEAVSVNQQPALDAYLAATEDDSTLLYPAFQNDFSGYGWRYQTYFDLLRTVREVNAALPAEKRLKVIAVNAPTYWSEIHTAKDVELFRLSLTGNDYTMYRIILNYLDYFRSGKKGIFLTNTRHAYKGIRNAEGKLYWNCGTFFHQWHPEKTYSVRFHNLQLYFQAVTEVDSLTPKTTEGLAGKVIKWVRMENGLWDSAFKAFGNRPVAFYLKDTPFGNATYIGNHMLNAAPAQIIYDAYDALIFLTPLESLRQTAIVDFIYTTAFKAELERRYRFLFTDAQLEKMLQEAGAESIRELIDLTFKFEPEKANPLRKGIGPINTWMDNKNQ